jgi:hypothetical protein
VNYTVVWLPDAESELAAIWVASAQQAAVTRAAAELDRRLAANSPAEGESRPNGRRITFEPPLAVIFRVYPATATVTVTRVWEFQ